MGIRRKSRELALQFLYQNELNETPLEDSFSRFCEHFETSGKTVPYAKELISGVHEKWEELNTLIQDHSANWRLSRMSLVDRSILRIAAYELWFCKEDVPVTVAIDEAIELSKRFSTDDSSGFINGILDAIHKSNISELD